MCLFSSARRTNRRGAPRVQRRCYASLESATRIATTPRVTRNGRAPRAFRALARPRPYGAAAARRGDERAKCKWVKLENSWDKTVNAARGLQTCPRNAAAHAVNPLLDRRPRRDLRGVGGRRPTVRARGCTFSQSRAVAARGHDLKQCHHPLYLARKQRRSIAADARFAGRRAEIELHRLLQRGDLNALFAAACFHSSTVFNFVNLYCFEYRTCWRFGAVGTR